jgi:hypothetical protein
MLPFATAICPGIKLLVDGSTTIHVLSSIVFWKSQRFLVQSFKNLNIVICSQQFGTCFKQLFPGLVNVYCGVDLVARMEDIIQFFPDLLQVAGGDLAPEKCMCYIISHRWENGIPVLLPVHPSHKGIKMTSRSTGTTSDIK